MQAITSGCRKVYLCDCERSIARGTGWGYFIFSLYQCKILVTYKFPLQFFLLGHPWYTFPYFGASIVPVMEHGKFPCWNKSYNGVSIWNYKFQEGQGRRDRKLAVAYHRRHKGKSEFTIAQSTKGILSSSDDSFIGAVTANLMGSKYHIWDQV